MRPDSDDRAGCDLPAGRYERIVVNAAAIRQGSTKLQYGDDFVFEACADSGETAEAVERFYLQEVRKRGVENVRFFPPSAHAEPALSRH